MSSLLCFVFIYYIYCFGISKHIKFIEKNSLQLHRIYILEWDIISFLGIGDDGETSFPYFTDLLKKIAAGY